MFADATPFTILAYPVAVGVYVISKIIGLVVSSISIPEEQFPMKDLCHYNHTPHLSIPHLDMS